MKKFGPIVIIAVVLAGTAGFREWHARQGEPGSISFQFVPKQRDSPIVLLSWTLERDHLSTPWIRIRNDAARAITSIAPVVVIATPTSVQRIDLPEVAADVKAGQTARLQLQMPGQWRDGAWQSYVTGAMVTLGVATARFADGTRWESAASGREAFAVSPDVEIKTPEGGLIGPRPPNFGNVWMLTASVSEYPISSSLDEGSCVMSACSPGRSCEYDGCQIMK
jgi:hypothetical protein